MISRALQIAVALLLIAVFGLGIYVLQTKHRAEQMESRVVDQRPIAPPVAGPQEPVALWVAHDADSSLHRENVHAALPAEPAERDREILRALLAQYMRAASPHELGPGADVKAVYLVGQDLAVIDLNGDFANRHPSGVLPESLTLASIAQTLSANAPEIKRVKFLVDGHERDTLAGHADLRGTYDLAVLAHAGPK